jgi:hypothetical protein
MSINNLKPKPQSIEFSDYFNETSEYSEQERDNLVVYSNDSHQHSIPIESFEYETENNEFYDYCKQITDQNFDVLLLFHEIDLNEGDNKNMIHYIIIKTKEFSPTRFAIGFYFKNSRSLSNMFDFNNFKLFSSDYSLFMSNFKMETFKDFTHTSMKNILNIRAKVLDLDWKSLKHKIVINLGYDFNLLNNFSVDNDLYTTSFKTKKIYFFNVKLDLRPI